MNAQELLTRINGLEWNDFEVKEAKSDVPKSAWETVSAFSNSYGGWLVFGIKERRKDGNVVFEIQGVDNPEKVEQDFIGVLRSNSKFNQRISVQAARYDINGRTVLAFYIPMSEYKPVYIGTPANTYIRVGSGDQRATDFEVRAMQRDQAFGKKSNEVVFGSSFADINQSSLQDYRNFVRAFNPELSYNSLSDIDFAVKAGVMLNGLLSVGGLLMFGKIDAILRFNPDFQIDYIEIPGAYIYEARTRYSYRMVEQENIWEYYRLIIQRIRTRVDNPYNPRPDGFAPDDNSRLYCLREALVNFLAHADYFSEIHSTIRVYDTHISMQNPGSFPVNLDIVGRTIVSQPRNPNILRLFKLAKLSENGGYGIDRILNWKALTGCDVTITSDITKSEVDFLLPLSFYGTNNVVNEPYGVRNEAKNDVNETNNVVKNGENVVKETDNVVKNGGNVVKETNDVVKNGKNVVKNGEDEALMSLSDRVLSLIEANNRISIEDLSKALAVTRRSIDRAIDKLKKDGRLVRVGSRRSGGWHLPQS